MITAVNCSNLTLPGLSRRQEWLPGDGCRPPVFYSFLAGGWIHAYRIKTRSQMRANCTAVTMMPTCCHVKLKLITSASLRTLRVRNASAVYKQLLTAHDINPVNAVPVPASKCSSSISWSGGGQLVIGLRILANNLMHALPAQLKLIRNLAKRLSVGTKIKYQRVALSVGRWTRLKWTPLPTRDSFELRNSGLRKQSLLAALTHVTNPRPKGYLDSINYLDMGGRYITVQLPGRELNECLFIKFEPGVVVHRSTIVQTVISKCENQIKFYKLYLMELLTNIKSCYGGGKQ